MDSVKENQIKKEYLKKYGESKKAIKRVDMQIEEINTCDPSSKSYITMNQHTTDDMSNYIAKKEKLIIDLYQEKNKWIDMCAEIYKSMNNLENEDEKNVLTLRYIAGMKWEEIALRMHLEWAQVHRIHARALKNLNMI